MITWIESHSLPVIALFGCGFCFAIAALVFVLTVAVSSTRLGKHLDFVAPPLVTPLGVILGLLLAFLAARVWTNVDRANAFVEQEANAIRELVRVADDLPSAIGDEIRGGVRTYLQWVLGEDWPSMMSGNGALRVSLPGIRATNAALAAFDTPRSGLRLMQQKAVAAADKVREARRGRILLSRSFIASSQWTVVLVLFVLMLVQIATIHIRRPGAMAFALGIFSSAFAICLVLLMINDRPFSQGGLTVEPVGLSDLLDQE